MRTTVDALTSCLGQAKNKWCHARRLVAANILWLWQLKWTIVDAGNLVTDTEMKLYLTIDSAAFVAQQGTESVRRGIAAELDVVFPTLGAADRCPITSRFRKALRRSKAPSKVHKLWSPKCKDGVRSATANGQ